MFEAINGSGRRAFYCPMPAIVKNSTILSIPISLAYLPVVVFQLARLIHRKKIDVVNCHYLDAYFIHLVIAARLMRVPLVVSVHGADVDGYTGLSRAGRLVCRLIMRGADVIVACSEALARQTKEVFPPAARKVTYVHNGLDPSRYRHASKSVGVPKPYLLSVCRHVHKKGIDTLLHAFVAIRREFPSLALALVGNGPLLETHKALARTLGIEDAVSFIGNVAHDEVSCFFEDCTLFVLPSRAEPFGLVLLEAAYHKKAVVCTAVGGVPEIMTNNQNGLLVQPDDPPAIATKIIELVRDPKRAHALGTRAYQTLMTRFLWKDRIHDYIAIYEGRHDDARVASSTAISTPARQTAPSPRIG